MNGEWTQWRGGPQRTGRAAVAGRITRPQVGWRHFAGCREDWIALGPGPGSRLALPAAPVEADLEAISRQYTRYLDVDSDGLEEFLLPAGQELIAFNGRGGKATEVWRLALPAPCREVVVADVDNDGLAEILAPCSDGYLYCVRGEKD